MARLETRKGDWLLGWFSAEPASSTPASLSSDRSAYAEAQGDDAAEEAYSEETSELEVCWLPACCRRAGRLEAGCESARRYDGLPRRGGRAAEVVEVKERAESSSTSHEGSAVSAAGDDELGGSGCFVEGRAASFLFFEEDVLNG